MQHFELPLWYDLHTHFRQGALTPALIADHIAMGCAGILAMPNTKPPVARVTESDHSASTENYWSIESYRDFLLQNGATAFDEIIIPLYLTQHTTPAMIEAGAKSGLLKAAKYYPPHGTTGADFGQPMNSYINNGVIQALSDNNITLCIHGEEHGLDPEIYFDRTTNAEEIFYQNTVTKLVNQFPNLKIVGEHVTTKIAADIIAQSPENVAGTITPQHLLYTVGHLLQGLKYHLYCLPLPKHLADREALLAYVTSPQNTKFFAGTDSAPHTTKLTPCGCAAGCYTGKIAPILYAMAFEKAGLDLNSPQNQQIFTNFLCLNGQTYYNLRVQTKKFSLVRAPYTPEPLITPDGTVIPLPTGMWGVGTTLPWQIKLL